MIEKTVSQTIRDTKKAIGEKSPTEYVWLRVSDVQRLMDRVEEIELAVRILNRGTETLRSD